MAQDGRVPTRTRRATALLGVALLAALVGVVGGPTHPAAAAPAVTVSPSGGLAQGHPVTVEMTGLAPSTQHLVHQCGETVCQQIPSPPPTPFMAGNSTVGSSDAAGALSVRLQVDRTFTVGATEVDCTTEACRVDVRSLRGGTIALVGSAPLAFTASGEHAWPQASLALARTTDLIGGQRVGATGSGYDWWSGAVYWSYGGTSTAAVEMCRAVAAPTAADCGAPERTFDAWSTGGGDVVSAPGPGSDASIRVRRHLTLASGPWDCARQGCTVALTQGGNPVSNRVRVRFAPEWAPWSNADHFIAQAVGGVAGRRLAPGAHASLKAALAARTTTGSQALVDASAGSAHDATIGELTRIYRAVFGRQVDEGGLGYWLVEHGRGKSLVTIARTFGRTAEFRAQYDGLTDGQVVDLVYPRTLGRAPTASEATYWEGRLAAGMSRADLVYSFARTPELRARRATEARAVIISWTVAQHVWPGWGPVEVARHALATVPPPPIVAPA